MDPNRRNRVDALVQSTLERKPEERAAFLADSCEGDADLRREVEALLAGRPGASSPDGSAPPAGNPTQTFLGQGAQLAHYRIDAPLGRGGMGVVYRARDTRLDRPVALKLLRPDAGLTPERKRRFVQEAKSASALNHPNIITIYDINRDDGVDFIAMEYVDGRPLQQLIGRGLSVSEALKYAVQAADGLAAAHEAGIVHRDLKPANIMVTGNGRVKLLDFGLAKLTGLSEDESREADPLAATRTQVLETQEGTVLGTVAYMSPEQAQGKKVDARSDVFSFGAVLYEMLTGRRAFERETWGATVSAILGEDAPRTATGTPLDEVIARCLAKKPDERFASGSELAEALKSASAGGGWDGPAPSARFWSRRGVAAAVLVPVAGFALYWIVGGRPEPVKTLAVLPFENAAGDPDAEYLSEGISDSLITRLTRVPGIRVRSRNAAFPYARRNSDVQTVGRELGVRAVLQGRLVRRGDSLSVTAELVDTSDGAVLWREQYDRRAATVLAIERDISNQIARQLRIELTGEEEREMARASTEDPEAHNLYLQGRYFWNRRTEESLQRSADFFRQAIDKDPAYALAWAGLGDSYLMLYAWSVLRPAEAAPLAQESALRAIELDPTLAAPHATLGYLKTLYDRDWIGAEREFARAIELDQEYSTAHHWYAFYLQTVGRMAEAIDEIELARRYEPLSPIISAEVGAFYLSDRQYDRAIEEAMRALALDDSYPSTLRILASAHAMKGNRAEALRYFDRLSEMAGGLADYSYGADVFVALGREEEARRFYQDLVEQSKKRYVMPALLGLLAAALDERDQAFEHFEAGYEDRSLIVSWLRGPRFDNFRSDRRYIELFQRMGLEP